MMRLIEHAKRDTGQSCRRVVDKQKLDTRCAKAKPVQQQPARSAPEEASKMARRSSVRRVDLREARREPKFSSAISVVGAAAKK